MSKISLEKTYAGFLGMNIGIRLGAPVEPAYWSYERIRRFYGDVRGYVKDFTHFAADDDANGPVFFLRALDDIPDPAAFTPRDVGQAWLNYAREGVGLYWWGGYGVSTEHTAYLNLKSGVPAPQSGSIAQNGKTLAEQIGGQIFVDTWGLIAPGDPERAAKFAGAAASVSHDGEGLNGARFMAAAIAAAFTEKTMEGVIEKGLAQTPVDCLYRKVFRAVEAFYRANPGDWRACRELLERDWGYDRYGGACHIIPNAGVCALAMYYGGGDFARTIEIAVMCSWDTDCNAGNLGTILGVFAGLEGIPAHYREPVNDAIVLSGISGYLNILDIPTYAKKLCALAYRMRGEPVPGSLTHVPDGELAFDFELPGSTHGFETDAPGLFRLSHSREKAFSGTGSLRIMMDQMHRGQGGRVFYKSFYRREDFDDERYMPVFSPTAYPGQTVTMRLFLKRTHGEAIQVTPYVREAMSKREYPMPPLILRNGGEWREISFQIPSLEGGLAGEIGLLIESGSPQKFFDAGCLYLDDFTLRGPMEYQVDFTQMKKEFASVLPFSHNHGAWELEGGKMTAIGLDHAEAMTGSYFMENTAVSCGVTPQNGGSHLLGVRVQGAQRGYYGGLIRDGAGNPAAALYRKAEGALRLLCAVPYEWEKDREVFLTLSMEGGRLTLEADGKALVRADVPNPLKYGMAALAQYGPGRTAFGNIHIKAWKDEGAEQ